MRRFIAATLAGAGLTAGIMVGISAPAGADIVLPLHDQGIQGAPNIVVPFNAPGVPDLRPEIVLPPLANCPPGQAFIINNGVCIRVG